MMVAEREIVDKRIEIYNEGVYYNISTSVPDDVIVLFKIAGFEWQVLNKIITFNGLTKFGISFKISIHFC